MSAKRLLPLAALFIIVVIAGLVLKRQPGPTQLADETGFERLVPPTLRVDSIRGVDLSLGDPAGKRCPSQTARECMGSSKLLQCASANRENLRLLNDRQ